MTMDELIVCEAVDRLRGDLEFADEFPPNFRQMASDLEIILDAYARLKYGGPWLVRTYNGKFRVKWRDAASVIQDRDFETESEARAFGATMTDKQLEFRGDIETALIQARELQKADPSLSWGQVKEKVGIVETVRRGTPEVS